MESIKSNITQGAVSLSSTILSKTIVGVWAFELDEGQPPRMYVDENMLFLLGLDKPLSPEDTYHAWIDHVTPSSIPLVNQTVEKMITGVHAEVQYPWIHPDGHVMTVRCGGLRNFNYTRGIRIEGTHQDVSNMEHYDDSLRVNNIIEQHMNTALAAVLVNTDTGLFVTIKRNEEVDEMLNIKMDSKYEVLLRRYTEMYVHADDKEKMYALSTMQGLKDAIGDKNEYSHYFRRITKEANLWYEMVVVHITENELLVYFNANNHAILDTYFHQAYTENLICGYILDMEKFTVHEIKKSPFLQIKDGTDKHDYREIIEVGSRLPDEEYRQGFLNFVNPENLLKVLKEQRFAEYFYSGHFNGVQRWVLSSLYPVKTADNNSHLLALSFTEYSKEMAEKEMAANQIAQQKAELEEKLKVIEALASEYSAVYSIDVKANTYKLHSLEEENATPFMDVINSIPEYDKAIAQFINQFIYSPDRALVLEASTQENLSKVLAHQKTFSITYRMIQNGFPVFCEMKYLKVDDVDKEPTQLILGFKNRDEDTLRNFVDEKMYQDYEAVYFANIKDNYVRAVKMSARYPNGPRFGKYVDEIKRYASNGPQEMYREQWLRFADKAYITEYLRYDDKREYLFKSYSDQWRRLTLQVCERDENGLPVAFVLYIIVLDNYESQKVDQLEKQNQQLEESRQALQEALTAAQAASRAKTTFLNSMSHDIRTPMNAIIGYTGLAARHIANQDLIRDYLMKISQSSEHLLSLINDILDMSRIESGKINLNEKAENISEIIHTLRNIVMGSIRSKQQEFYIDTIDVHDEDIICDKLRLNQVLLNIISNSIKYTQSGGMLTLRIRQLARKRTGYACYEFRIKDNGMGMSPEFLSTIFDPFTRANSTTVSGIQGTGLGMTITKSITEMMGGTIEVQSQQNVGTEVYITFEFKLASEHHELGEITQLRGLRGLVVDDDGNTCLSISRMLSATGVRSEWCTSGKEAVFRAEASVQDGDPYLIYIIDWLIPDQNGLETARRIRKVIGNEAPIIIVTAYDTTDIELEAREAGVTALISKPLFPSDLHSTLEKCCLPTSSQSGMQVDGSEYNFAGKHLLLVEDNEMNMEIAQMILEAEGFVVDTAHDGTEAVEKVRNSLPGQYDMVLMDIQMPIMDGYEATRQIRALSDPRFRMLPIIAVTANAFDEDRQLAFQAGMNDHIDKPIDVDLMRKIMAKYI